MLEDIAILTGGKAIFEDLGHQARERQARGPRPGQEGGRRQGQHHDHRGRRQAKEIEGRIKQIRAQIEETTSDYDREKLQERLAKLAGGVAVINVGAATETEMKEKKARVEDALHATRAAVEEGIVPGGGVALLRAAKALDNLKLQGDEATGVDIVRRALEEPIRQIVAERRARGLGRGREGRRRPRAVAQGFNAETERVRRHVQAGIIDPTKVERIALQNAASIASLLLTTEALITDIPKTGEDGRRPCRTAATSRLTGRGGRRRRLTVGTRTMARPPGRFRPEAVAR